MALRAALAVLAAGALAASDRDRATQRCSPVTLTVSRDPVPVFSWSPACAMTDLRVRLSGPGIPVWEITGTYPRYRLLPPITYGQGPEGSMTTTPADTLYPSATYDVIVARSDFTGLVSPAGQASFRPAATTH